MLLLPLSMSLVTRSDASNFRILPVGDSITAGVGSSDGNSYRLDLRNMLISAGRSEYASKIESEAFTMIR